MEDIKSSPVMVRLGDICKVVSGTIPKTENPDYWDGNINWITPAEITDDTTVIYESQRKITPAGVKSCGLTPFPAGTVILSSRAPIGKTAIAGVDMYCNQGFKNLICSELVFNKYLFWFLRSKTEYLNFLGRGATFKEISKKIVADIEIPLVPMEQQQHIAALLDKVSVVIALRKRQLAKLDELVKARFVEMFGDPTQAENKWQVSTFGDEFYITSGGTPDTKNSAYWEHGTIPWIGSNMCQDKIVFQNDGKHITTDGLAHSSAKVFESGTVLVALVGATIGKTALLRFATATNQNVAAIDVNKNKNFTSEYVYYHLQFLYCLGE